MVTASESGYSAHVRLTLRVNGAVHDLSEIGPDWITLRHPVPLRPGPAVVEMAIDGSLSTWSVMLQEPSDGDSRSVRLLRIEPEQVRGAI
jgi:hypothetical protein